jgi:hypothetical protein
MTCRSPPPRLSAEQTCKIFNDAAIMIEVNLTQAEKGCYRDRA